MPTIKKTIASAKNRKPRLRANSGPTDDTLRQCGHRAKALFSVLNCQLVKVISLKSLEKHYSTGWTLCSPKTCPNNGHMWRDACPASMAPAVSLDSAPNLWFVCNSVVGTQFSAMNFYIWASNCMDIERISCPAEHFGWAENELGWMSQWDSFVWWVMVFYRSLLALMTLDNMLLSLVWYIDHCLAHTACHHWHTSVW